MSLLKQHKTKILQFGANNMFRWKDNQMALNIISQGQFKLFQDSLNENSLGGSINIVNTCRIPIEMARTYYFKRSSDR